jgi:hypothetical protein
MAQISRPPPWRLGVRVDLARATTTAAQDGDDAQRLHGEHGVTSRESPNCCWTTTKMAAGSIGSGPKGVALPPAEIDLSPGARGAEAAAARVRTKPRRMIP